MELNSCAISVHFVCKWATLFQYQKFLVLIWKSPFIWWYLYRQLCSRKPEQIYSMWHSCCYLTSPLYLALRLVHTVQLITVLRGYLLKKISCLIILEVCSDDPVDKNTDEYRWRSLVRVLMGLCCLTHYLEWYRLAYAPWPLQINITS